MRIEITHQGEDYVIVTMQKSGEKKVVEYTVPREIGIELKSFLRAVERIVCAAAIEAM